MNKQPFLSCRGKKFYNGYSLVFDEKGRMQSRVELGTFLAYPNEVDGAAHRRAQVLDKNYGMLGQVVRVHEVKK